MRHPSLTDIYLKSLGIEGPERWHILTAAKQPLPPEEPDPGWAEYSPGSWPPTTNPHIIDNPTVTTLIKALTHTIHQLKAYQSKETANQPITKAEMTAILAYLREHLKTVR